MSRTPGRSCNLGKSLGRLSLLLCLPTVFGCTVSRVGIGDDDGGGIDLSTYDAIIPCNGVQCKIPRCLGGAMTTIHGVVNIPAGNLPIYNATVYVPVGPLEDIPDGVSCNRCDAVLSGGPLVKTTTDSSGHFSLSGVPAGDGVPLVIQVGKWRRQVMLQGIVPCVDNTLDTDKTRLPRNQSEGHIPKIALTTGGADVLECLMRKLGIDDSEFTMETGKGRINLYDGEGGTSQYIPSLNGGATFTAAPTFWNTLSNLQKYDMIVHSCEGDDMATNKSPQALQALHDYLYQGGRVFGSHYHNYWVSHGPQPMPSVATFNERADPDDPVTANIDTSFTAGATFADWLVNVGGSTTRGQLVLHQGRNTVQAVNAAIAQQWITIPSISSIQYLSFDTPIGVDPTMQCGRMVLSDIHVAAGDTPGSAFPSGCAGGALTPQEMSLIYMLFQLSNCLEPVIG